MNNIQHGMMVASLAVGALASQAAQYWWSGNGTTLGGSGTWDTASTNWSATGAAPFEVWPNSGSDEAVFTNTAGTVTLSGTIKAKALLFKANAWTLTGGALDFVSSAGTISLTNSAQATINSALVGAEVVNLASSGNSWQQGLKLYGDNSGFTGRIVAQKTAGNYFWLHATNDFNFGAVPAVYTADALTLSGGTAIQGGSSALTIPANRGITLGSGGGMLSYASYVVNSRITGSGGLSLRNATVTFNQTNDFAGGVSLNGGVAVMGVDNALPHGTGKGNYWWGDWNGTSTINLNGHILTINGLTFSKLANNSAVNNTAAGTATLVVGDGNATGNTYGGLITSSGGALSLTKIGTGTQTLSGSCTYAGSTTVNGGILTISGTNSASSGMTVNNAGTLVVSGFLSNAVPLTVNAGGTLQADLSVNTAGVFNSASAVTLAGGTLNIKGKSSGTSATALGSLTVEPAGSTVSLTPNGGGGTALTLGNTWTRSVGGTLLVDVSAAGSTVSSSPTLQNGIIGGYAFVKDNSGLDFATVSGGNVVRYTGATVLDASAAAADLSSTVNYNLDTDRTLTGASTTQTVNSLRLNNATLTLGSKVLVVGSGGIIFSNATWRGISGGAVTAGGSDLVIYAGFVANSDLHSFASPIVDNGGPVGVTLACLASGVRFALQGANSYSGDTVINGGTLRGVGLIPIGAGKGNLVINYGGGADMASGSLKLNGLASSPGNPGGWINSTWGTAGVTYSLTVGNGNATASYSGLIANGGAGYYVALIKVGSGTQTLAGVNTYSGGTIISNGVLSVSSVDNIGGANAKVTFAGGTLRISGTAFNSFGAAPLTFTPEGGGLDIADTGNSFTLTNDLASGTVLAKTGAGTLSLTGAQAGTINTDDPSKISFGAGLGFYNLGLTSGGVLSPAGSGTNGTVAVNNNFTLAGKLLADVTASTNDTVTAGGSITLSAGATLELVNPSLLSRSKQYTLMTAGGGAVSGSLTALNLPDRWKVSAVGSKVVLYYAYPGTMIRVF